MDARGVPSELWKANLQFQITESRPLGEPDTTHQLCADALCTQSSWMMGTPQDNTCLPVFPLKKKMTGSLGQDANCSTFFYLFVFFLSIYLFIY